MLTTQVISAIDRMRDSDEGHFYADAILAAFQAYHAELTGTLRVEAPDHDANTSIYPPDRPNLRYEDAPGSRFGCRWNFMAPGDKGAQGGYHFGWYGPAVAVPNREGDVVLHAPNGSIDAKQFYMNGHEIPLPPDSGSYVLIVEDGVFSWEELEDC